jgi:hypothetical protein
MALDSAQQDFFQFDRASLAAEVEEFCVCLQASLRRAQDVVSRATAISRLRESVNGDGGPFTLKGLESLFLRHVFLDLANQGWSVVLTSKLVTFRPGDKSGEIPAAAKDRIRQQHLQERDAQLREPSVREFIRQMERRRLTPQGWHSIFSVMRDGSELANKLQKAATISDVPARELFLADCIDPYVQPVDPKAVCIETGLKLGEIWRYFRHTWTNSYRSTPGRSIAFLVRDKSMPNHPVIGIAALGSSVVQQSVRDTWIGWDAHGIIEEFCNSPSPSKIRWLHERVESQIAAIYKQELLREKIITKAQIRRPEDSDIQRLMKESDAAIKRHRLFPDKHQLKQNGQYANWRKTAETDLFRSKRCKQLAILLSIRKIFQDCSLQDLTKKELEVAGRSSTVRRAVTQLFRQIKAERVGICMMDITVCGAIAPYNAILGGKLVCLLLASPEIVEFYRTRYAKQVSVIASGMSGREVTRSPKLVLLCTTSLYGGGSSQYNRLKIPAGCFGDIPIDDVEFSELGVSEGFGSFHFSKETIRAADGLLGRKDHGRKVNSIFGEGVNPLMRKMREALTEVGLPSEILLRHGNKRIVYGVPLAANFREVLMSLSDRPKYTMSLKDAAERTENIASFWRSRWLSKRILREGILEEVGRHQLSFPVNHGAMVEIPDESWNDEHDFSSRLGS